MQRLSSNLTLFFKFFIPVFWLVFFGAFLIATFVYGGEVAAVLGRTSFRIGAVVFYFSGILLFAFTLFPLKRVEGTAEHAYVTNYFKTVRYSWDSFEQISESRFLVFRLVTLSLKEKGTLGRKLRFVASRRLLDEFKATHPDIFQ